MNTPVGEALAEYRARLHPVEPSGPGAARWRGWLVAGLTVLMLIGGLRVWLRPDLGPTPAQAAPLSDDSRLVDLTGGRMADEPSPEPRDVASPEAQTSAPLVVAPATSWRPWATSALRTWLPTSPAGPQDAAPGHLAGFTRTPEGALVAAANVYPAIYYTRDRAAWGHLADYRVVWADGARDALWDALEPVWSLDGGDLALRPVGFRMLSYTADLSRVRLWWRTATPSGEPVIVGAIATVRWVDGDWWLVFDEPASDLRPLDSARDGYVPWGPGAAP